MRAAAALLILSLAACSSGTGTASAVPSTATDVSAQVIARRTLPPPPTHSPTPSYPYSCPSASTSSGTLDCTKLPLGDQKYSTTSARVGYVYSCMSLSGSPVVSSAPWLNSTAKTWSLPGKIAVSGSVSWNGSYNSTVSGSTNAITSQEVPTSGHTTGTFPIQSSDPAYQYDKNPNSIAKHTTSIALPANPVVNATPTCLGMGIIGITTTGVAIYNGFDAAGYDAVAREEQDGCHGHPDQSSTYHYHGVIQACVSDSGSASQNSTLLGYGLDGFGIYGPWFNGKILTTADLDACHGTTSPVMWNGKLVSMYHYVSTYDFPYTLGCYRGTPVKG